jgi:hypothetical protein
LEFEEPAFITLGLCYEERPRFSGGTYHSVLKRVDAFLKKPMRAAIELRRAKTLLALDDQICSAGCGDESERPDKSLPQELRGGPGESYPIPAERCRSLVVR